MLITRPWYFSTGLALASPHFCTEQISLISLVYIIVRDLQILYSLLPIGMRGRTCGISDDARALQLTCQEKGCRPHPWMIGWLRMRMVKSTSHRNYIQGVSGLVWMQGDEFPRGGATHVLPQRLDREKGRLEQCLAQLFSTWRFSHTDTLLRVFDSILELILGASLGFHRRQRQLGRLG